MLHPYREASRMQIPLVKPVSGSTPGQELLALLGGVNDWLDGVPSVESLQGTTVYILYRNVIIPIGEFWDIFGRTMARISQIWPFCAFGTAQNQETIRLSAQADDTCVQLIQQSISGKKTDVLGALCFQIDCTNTQTAENLVHVLTAVNWQTDIVATSWKDAGFLREHALVLDLNLRGLFCYAGINSEATPKDLLYSLDFTQKIALWTAFLKDGFEPIEFEWLADEISKGTLVNRMEWELALHEAMDQLNFRMINQEKYFEVFDSTGRRLYFGADGNHAAEWALLKILFPLNYQ